MTVQSNKEGAGMKKTYDNKYIPTSYEDMYLYYFVGNQGDSLAKSLIRSFVPYAEKDEQENLLHDAFLRLRNYDILEKMDLEKMKTANFGGTIYFAVRSVCVNYLEKKTRDPLGGLYAGTIVPESDTEVFEVGTYNLSTVSGVVADREEEEDPISPKKGAKVSGIMSKLSARARNAKNVRDSNLVKVANFLMEGYEVKDIAENLGVTVSTIHNWLKEIKAVATA